MGPSSAYVDLRPIVEGRLRRALEGQAEAVALLLGDGPGLLPGVAMQRKRLARDVGLEREEAVTDGEPAARDPVRPGQEKIAAERVGASARAVPRPQHRFFVTSPVEAGDARADLGQDGEAEIGR